MSDLNPFQRLEPYELIISFTVIALLPLGGLLSLILFFILLISFQLFATTPRAPQDARKIPAQFPRFSFTECNEWVRSVENLEALRIVKTELEVSKYSENLNGLVDLIIKDFVEGWHSSISQDPTFINEVKSQLNTVVNLLEDRVKNVDVPRLVVLRLLPLLTNHFETFLKAKDAVDDELKKTNKTLGINELNARIFKEFEAIAGAHRYVKMEPEDLENGIRSFSRDRVNDLLPHLVSTDELKSNTVKVLIRELLSQTVFVPLLRVLSDPDFWNRIIIKFATITLKDRDQVRELKRAIDKQTSRSNKNVESANESTNLSLQNKISSNGRRITPQMKQQEFEKYLKNIEGIDSLSQLKQLRYVIALQINRTQNLNSTSENFTKYCKRLNLTKEKIELKILETSSSSAIKDPKNSLIFNPNNDLEDFIQNLSLFQVLTNPSALPFFSEFMKNRERADLLKFWITVNEIKDPLEDPRIDIDDGQSFDEISSFSTAVDTKDVQEIKFIFDEFFNKQILAFEKPIYDQVEAFCESDEIDVEEFSKIRKLIISLQIKTFKKMETYDFKDFKNSDSFLKLLSSETFEESLISEVDNLEEKTKDADFGSDSELQQGESLMEIENALNTILTKPDPNEYHIPSSTIQATTSTKKLKSELFGKDDDGFLDEKPLFQEDQQRSNSVIPPELLDEDFEFQNDFIKPSHDKFNLKEDIASVTAEIAKLNKQSSILDPLILKAELMNNSQELRLLKKSKSSYQREIESKELIKQQLIVQDNEDSLFGKTTIAINSWVKGRSENGKDYIIFLIEVEKGGKQAGSDGEKMNWVVGRRFSQFWRMNEHLKKLNGSLMNDIIFPKKKIVLKFQEKSIVDERRVQLENYLRQLLRKPQICQDREFRKFLTLEDYHKYPSLLSKKNSSTASIPKLKDTANILYNGLYSSIDLLRNTSNDRRESLQLSQELDASELDNPLESSQTSFSNGINFNNISTTVANTPFIKPITDLFTTLFPLSNQTNNWIRGQAIVLILQQMFGSTIEKHLKSMISQKVSVERVDEVILLLKDTLWPKGVFMTRQNENASENKEVTEREQMKEKIKNFQDSKMLLNELIKDVFGKIVGNKRCESTGGEIHGMIQLNVLNLELIMNVFDLILVDLYGELDGGQ